VTFKLLVYDLANDLYSDFHKTSLRKDTATVVLEVKLIMLIFIELICCEICKYRGFLTFVDRFTALRYTGTGAPPAARRIRILPMNQHARWPIIFGFKGIY
jgi:hypothetical protein